MSLGEVVTCDTCNPDARCTPGTGCLYGAHRDALAAGWTWAPDASGRWKHACPVCRAKLDDDNPFAEGTP